MGDTNKSLRNNRGMTLVEVMMAVAVFGIIMTTFTMAVKGYYHLNTDNLDQMRMMELARAETEMIKNSPNDLITLGGTIASRAYPPTITRATTGGEQIYKIKYKKEPTTNPTGTMLKITVAPDTATDLDKDPNNYVLASWLPISGGVPTASTLTTDYWGYTSNLGTDPIGWPVQDWTISNGTFSKNGGNSGVDYMYYKIPQAENFDYKAYLNFSKIQGHGDKVGITIGTNEFYLLDDKLYYNSINIPLNDPSFTMKENVKYYLRANKVDTTLNLYFGLSPNNEIGYLSTTIASGNYYVGIFDQSTSNLNDEFSFP